MSEPTSESAQMRPRRIIVLVPLILFLGLKPRSNGSGQAVAEYQ